MTKINMDMRRALDEMITVQEDKMAVDAALEQLDGIMTVTDAERAQVEKEASVVMDSMISVMNEVSSLQGLTSEASEANNNVARNRLVAYSKERLAVEKETEAENEAQKPENKNSCPRCMELKAEAKKLREERSNAIKEAGRSAQRARAAMLNANAHGRNIIRTKEKSAGARARVVEVTNKIMERARISVRMNIGWGSGGEPNTGSGGSGGEPNTGSGGSGGEPSTGSGGSGGEPNTGSGGSGNEPNTGSSDSGDESNTGSGGSGYEPNTGSGGSGGEPSTGNEPNTGNKNKPSTSNEPNTGNDGNNGQGKGVLGTSG